MNSLTVECDVHFSVGRRGRKRLVDGAAAPEAPARTPRVARLMALAIRFEGLIRDGHVADYAELARRGRVTRARITQIMNLLLLAPDIQEELLFLPRVEKGHDPLCLRMLQPIAGVADWRRQRTLWRDTTGALLDQDSD